MSTVILCNGNYAKNPYYLAADEIRFFSIEEVCYYLYKNAFFLQEDFFDDSLLSWMREELGLSSWADALLQYRGTQEALLQSIEYLFFKTGYYGAAEFEKVKKVLLDGRQLSVEDRRKMRADAYCKKQKFKLALVEYEDLLKHSGEEQVKFRAKILHNMGVCHAGMLLYDQAADTFKKAFDTYPNTESYVQFLTALKLGSPQAEYLSYLSEHPESYEDSLEVERRLKNAEESWQTFYEDDKIERRMEEENISYYAAVSQMLKQIKEEYTSMVNKG